MLPGIEQRIDMKLFSSSASSMKIYIGQTMVRPALLGSGMTERFGTSIHTMTLESGT
jgi:hypothetical protein